MDFSEPPRQQRGESIVPMINVVFLLLIFFLMTSQIAPPEPFEVAPPRSARQTEPKSELVLYADKHGKLAFEDTFDDAAIAALSARSFEDQVIQLRADGELAASELALVLRRLSEAGLARVELVVVPA